LVEFLVAVVLFGVLFSAVLTGYSSALSGQRLQDRRAQFLMVGQHIMEDIASRDFQREFEHSITVYLLEAESGLSSTPVEITEQVFRRLDTKFTALYTNQPYKRPDASNSHDYDYYVIKVTLKWPNDTGYGEGYERIELVTMKTPHSNSVESGWEW